MKRLSRYASFAVTALAAAAFWFAGPQAPAEAQQKVLIGVSLPQDDNPFYIAMLKGIRERAAELGWEVAAVSSNEDKIRQISGVEDLVTRGAKGILISPIDAVGVNAAYAAAKTAGIPIISVARGSASPDQTFYVSMDEAGIGEEIGRWTAQKIGGEGKVALLLGPSGAPTFRNLERGYMKALQDFPNVKVAFRSDGPLTRERGLKQAEDALVANPDLKAIYTANDDVALGALQAVAAADRIGKTLVTGMNGVPPALKALKEGNLALTVELNPMKWGRLGVDVMADYLNRKPPQGPVHIKHVLIDSQNVDAVLSGAAK
jgi:ribose transport system substrate-binding protein